MKRVTSHGVKEDGREKTTAAAPWPFPRILGPLLDHSQYLTDEVWIDAARKGNGTYDAVETLLKGLEIRLPDGCGLTTMNDRIWHPAA